MVIKTEYGIVDSISNLVLVKESDYRGHLSELEVYEEIGRIEEVGIKYFVPINKKEVICLSKSIYVKGLGEYYDNWNDVPEDCK